MLSGKIPGNVIGMLLFFILLMLGFVKLHHIEEVSEFFLKNMAFFFIPACLGILDAYPQIKSQLFPILFICIVTTFITAAATALTVKLVLKIQTNKQEVCVHD